MFIIFCLINKNVYVCIDIEISSEIDDLGGLLEMGKSGFLAIRSMRNLQEIDKKKQSQSYRVHRKIGDF